MALAPDQELILVFLTGPWRKDGKAAPQEAEVCDAIAAKPAGASQRGKDCQEGHWENGAGR